MHQNGQPQRPNDIAIGIGAPKSTVYEIVNRLVDEKILEPYDKDGRLFLGRKLHFFGTRYLEQFDLLRQAEPVVTALSKQTGETAQLCIIDSARYIVVLTHSGARHFKISSDLGQPIPLTWTTSGRLLLMGMSEQAIVDFIPPEDFTLPDGSQLPLADFLAEIDKAVADGYVSSKSVVDAYTRCYAAPITDHAGSCVATLCMVTPRGDDRRRRNQLRDTLLHHAADLTDSLGGKT
ncbi:MAG: IclR family transcriptional regulator [Alphaproteobacteria bacterium]|nr:IclR family transcriptional regulator [Alphaproteobacteria bacterium]